MRTDFVRRIAGIPPGDRVVLLRSLATRYTEAGNASSLARLRVVAARYDVRLDIETVEVASADLSDRERAALRTALADPAACRRLAGTCLGGPAHA